jgi:photosystem II stability/assembly factor-like uncharacterized protein
MHKLFSIRRISFITGCLIALTGATPGFAQFWTKMGAISIPVQSLAVSPTGTLFAGTDGSGVYRSTDHGGTWVQCTTNINLTGDVRAISVSRTGIVYVADFSKGLYRSTEDGNNWDLVKTANSAFSVAVGPEGTVYFGRDTGVFASTDNGNNWVNSGILGASKIPAIAVDSQGNAYASNFGFGSGVYRSSNLGATWTKTAFPEANEVGAIAATRDGKILAGEEEVYLSTDGGDHWTKTTGQLHGRKTMAIDSNGIVYLPDYGASSSKTYFGTWTLNSTGWDEQENVVATGLAFDKENYLYAASEGGTFYRSTIPSTTLNVKYKSAKTFAAIYPNPTSTRATLTFETQHSAHSTLRIENVLGSTVAEIDLGWLAPGKHTVTQNFDLPEGTYTYRIFSGSVISSGKMTVIR